MVDGGSARGRLLWGQERAHLLPGGVGEGGQPWDQQGGWEMAGDGRGLERAPLPMTALRSRLMLAPQPRPVQASGLLVFRCPDRLQDPPNLWDAQRDPLRLDAAFFPASRAWPCSTTRAA